MAELNRLKQVENRMKQLAREARGERLVGGVLTPGTKPTDERRVAIRQEQARLARKALGR